MQMDLQKLYICAENQSRFVDQPDYIFLIALLVKSSENSLAINVSAKFSESTCSCGSQCNSMLQDQEKSCPLLIVSSA